MKKIYTTIAALLIGFSFSAAQTIVYPSQDMTTNTGNSGMFPTSDQLWIATWSAMQNYHQTLIKFDLDAYSGNNVDRATLKLNQFFHAPDGTPTPSKIYAITEDWDESTWSTSTNVAHSTTEFAAPTFTSTLGWYEIDITELVNQWLDGSLENYGLVIVANSGTKFSQFYSKDATSQANHPQVVLEGVNAVEESEIIAEKVSVVPNPVADNATMRFTLSSAQNVRISLISVLGQEELVLSDRVFPQGQNLIHFSVNELNRGFYILQIQIASSLVTKKISIK